MSMIKGLKNILKASGAEKGKEGSCKIPLTLYDS